MGIASVCHDDSAWRQGEMLVRSMPSWNDGLAKRAVVDVGG